MFNSDLLVAFLFMALLFLRQVAILKKPNKLNYAPLMIGIGAISSVIHFIIQPDTSDVILLLRESFFPLLVALLLYIVMNILHQTQESQNARVQSEFSRVVVSEIAQLKAFILELEERMNFAHQEDRAAQAETREKFKSDIKALDSIKVNQEKFLDKFLEVEAWHAGVSKSFAYFSEVQLPELDGVVHKHIDILRVSEQDHYNKLSTLLQKGLQSRAELSSDMQKLKQSLSEMKGLAGDVAKSIADETLQRISSVTKAFEFQMGGLKSHAESLTITLQESESRLSTIRSQSEMVMKQMLLSSKKMDELEKQNSGLHNLYASLQTLTKDLESVKSEYLRAELQIASMMESFTLKKDEQFLKIQESVESMSSSLLDKIEESLLKLEKQYNAAEDDISKNVQFLAKRAQIHKGYGGEPQEKSDSSKS